jgi:membrane associated rhomboid family serine protease
MGYRDYYSTKRTTSIWSENNALLMLIALNVFAYITLRFILAVYGLSNLAEAAFYKNIFQWFALPGDARLFITRPWTLLSSGFTQMDLWMMISNMFWLWTFGFIFQDLTGNRRIIPLYIYGTVAAGLFYLVGFALFPQLRQTANAQFYYGAMAPIIAVAVGATAFAPSYRIFPMIGGGIPLWVITAVFLIVDIFFLQQHAAWFFPHLAAAATGFFFVLALKRGSDWGEWMNNLYYRLTNLFTPRAKIPPRRPVKQEVFYNTRGHQPYKKTTNLTQQRIDEILDKINVKGYEKLTEEEKELLRRASEEDL